MGGTGMEIGVKMPKLDQMPKTDQMPKMDQMPKTDKMPKMVKMPTMDQMPKTDKMPKMDNMPKMNQMPKTDQMPRTDNMPNIPKMEEMALIFQRLGTQFAMTLTKSLGFLMLFLPILLMPKCILVLGILAAVIKSFGLPMTPLLFT